MGATRVQTKAGNPGTYVQNYSFTFDNATTNGNTIILAIAYNNDQAGAASVTDNKGNTFYKVAGGDSGGDTEGELWYAYNITGGASHQITVTFAANWHDSSFVAREYAGLTTTDPLDKSASGATAAGTSHSSATTAATTQASELVVGALALTSNSTFTLGSGFSNLANANGSDLYEAVALEDKDVTSTGTQQATMTSGTSAAGYFIVATFKEASSATIEQEGFAFGDDDGAESAHTLGTQDANLTAPLGTKTLRLLLNATGDPSSNAYKLKYKKNGSGGYATVPVGSVTPGQTGEIEIGDITGSGNNTASGSWAVSHPAASAGDLLIFNIGWDDSTTTTGLTVPSGKNGETAILIEDVVASSSTSVRGKVVAYKCTGAWSAGTLTFTPSASEQWQAGVIKVPAGEFDPTTPIGADASLASTTTGNPTTPAFSAGASDGGGRLVAFIVGDVDDPEGAASGWTDRGGNDIGAVGVGISTRNALVTDSESIAAASGWTFPSARDWVTFCYIVRPPADVTNQLYIATSSNVAAGGENTTARLAAPSGKTTSDFDTGRRWDNENGSDSLDITDGDYTEVEWILTTQSPAATNDYFEFRVYNGDSALTTYTVTPKWTIGSSGVNVSCSLFGEPAGVIAPSSVTTGASFTCSLFGKTGAVIAPASVTGGVKITTTLFGSLSGVIAPTSVKGGVAFTVALFGHSAAFIAPTSVTGGVIVSTSLFGNSSGVIAPSVVVIMNVTPSLFGHGSGMIAPAVTGGASAALALFGSGSGMIAPTSVTGGAATAPALFGVSSGVIAPASIVGGVGVTPEIVAAAGAFIAPTVTTGAVIELVVFGAPAAFLAPTATGGAAAEGSVFGVSSGFFAVTVITQTVVEPEIFGSLSGVIAPASVTGGVLATPEAFGALSGFYEASVSAGAAVSVSLFGSLSGVIEPTAAGGVGVAPSPFGATAAFISPASVTGGATAAVSLFGTLSGTFSPEIATGAVVAPDIFGSGAAFLAPTVTSGAAVSVSLFGVSSGVLAPLAAGGAAAAVVLFGAGSGVIAPTVTLDTVIYPAAIPAVSGFFAPTIAVGADFSVSLFGVSSGVLGVIVYIIQANGIITAAPRVLECEAESRRRALSCKSRALVYYGGNRPLIAKASARPLVFTADL